MTQLPHISCRRENHRAMPFQYVCLHPDCREHGHQIACLYCAEEFHKAHADRVVAIKNIVNSVQGKQPTQYNILRVLLQGITTCATQHELKTNVAELLSYRDNPNRFQELIDEETKHLQSKAASHYQRDHNKLLQQQIMQKNHRLHKPLITPLLSFQQGENYHLISPFSITNKDNQLVTAFAYPNLSKFHDSIDIKVKVNRQTPSWLGIGLSMGAEKYEQKSNKHILALSNGWLNNRGSLQRTRLKFKGGDEVRLKWNKNTQLLELQSRQEKLTIPLASQWNEQIYLCVCLFYKDDSVSILA